MAVIIAVQLVLPLGLIAWLAVYSLDNVIGRIVQILAIAVLIAALALAGLWMQLPAWLTAIYGLLLTLATFGSLRRMPARVLPRTWVGWSATALFAALAIWSAVTILSAARGRIPPGPALVKLRSPLTGPGLYVANGGSTDAVNPGHLMTLSPAVPRFRRYRGQSYAVDIVRRNSIGRTSTGLQPADPAAYMIFADPVRAPCSGRVVSARSDRLDMPVPVPDRDFLLGNHVVLDCGAVHVVLAHLRRGSLAVRTGQSVPLGALLGTVGNSGNSTEPHLHIHAQTPGTAKDPVSGVPLPMSIGGRYLVRNDRLS